MATATVAVKEATPLTDEQIPAEPLPAHFLPRDCFATFPLPHTHAITHRCSLGGVETVGFLNGHKAFREFKPEELEQYLRFFEGSESAKRHPWSSLVSPETAVRRWGFREYGKWVIWNQPVATHATNFSRSDLVDRFFNRRYMDRFRAIAGVRVKRWAELKSGPVMTHLCFWPDDSATATATQFRGLGSLEDCIGLDYEMSPILLEPVKAAEPRKWKSGRLSVADKSKMLSSVETQTAIFVTAWQAIGRLYSKGMEHEEQKHIADLVRSDVTAALYGRFCRDGRAFVNGRRVKRPQQWKGGKDGLIRLATRYAQLRARATMGKEWTQFRPTEFVPESVTAVQTGMLVQSLEETLGARSRKSRGRKLADDIEYAAFGKVRLLCQKHDMQNAERIDLIGDYKLACGCVRAEVLPVQI